MLALFALPSCLLLQNSYSLPTYPVEKVGLCSLERVPVFLFEIRAPAVVAASDSDVDASDSDVAASAPEYLMGGISRDESVYGVELPSHLQCSMNMKMKGCDPTFVNMLGLEIIYMGHQYQMSCWNPEGSKTVDRGVAFLEQLNWNGGTEFVLLRRYDRTLLVLESSDRKWKRLENIPNYMCPEVVSFKDKFYIAYREKDLFAINPSSLRATRLRPSKQQDSVKMHLVPSGDDELFLIEETCNRIDGLTCRVSRLDAKGRKWVEVSDLGDRVLFVGCLANVACFANQLPDGCGVGGNSIFLTNQTGDSSFYLSLRVVGDPQKRGMWRSSDLNLRLWLSGLSVISHKSYFDA